MTMQYTNPTLRFGLHFVPLFAVAFTAWVALQIVIGNGPYVVQGLIAATLLAALGTYFALRGDGRRDLRGRDAVEGYEIRQKQRTMARTGTPFAIRASGPRTGNASGD